MQARRDKINMGFIFIMAWILIMAVFISIGLLACNLFLFVLGFLLLFIPFAYGDYKYSQTPKGKKENIKKYEKQRKIEEEFGIIEYWENK